MRDSVFLAVTNSNLHSDQKQKRKKKYIVDKANTVHCRRLFVLMNECFLKVDFALLMPFPFKSELENDLYCTDGNLR